MINNANTIFSGFSNGIDSLSNLKDYETINFFTINNNVSLNNNIFINILLLLSIVCAIFTILSKNPIVSVLFLIGLYVNIAAYLILIGSQFIGLAYILIYIGAISILFIFILMLINIRISELVDNSQNSVFLIVILAIIINYVIYNYILSSNYIYNLLYNNNYIYYNDKLFFISNIIWDSNIIEYNSVSSLGNTLYSNYFILFIIASIILLLAMIGAIIITIKPIEYSNYNKINYSKLHSFVSLYSYNISIIYLFLIIINIISHYDYYIDTIGQLNSIYCMMFFSTFSRCMNNTDSENDISERDPKGEEFQISENHNDDESLDTMKTKLGQMRESLDTVENEWDLGDPTASSEAEAWFQGVVVRIDELRTEVEIISDQIDAVQARQQESEGWRLESETRQQELEALRQELQAAEGVPKQKSEDNADMSSEQSKQSPLDYVIEKESTEMSTYIGDESE